MALKDFGGKQLSAGRGGPWGHSGVWGLAVYQDLFFFYFSTVLFILRRYPSNGD